MNCNHVLILLFCFFFLSSRRKHYSVCNKIIFRHPVQSLFYFCCRNRHCFQFIRIHPFLNLFQHLFVVLICAGNTYYLSTRFAGYSVKAQDCCFCFQNGSGDFLCHCSFLLLIGQSCRKTQFFFSFCGRRSPPYTFNPLCLLEYFIIIQERIRKHKMFAWRTPFFVEKHENPRGIPRTIAKR